MGKRRTVQLNENVTVTDPRRPLQLASVVALVVCLAGCSGQAGDPTAILPSPSADLPSAPSDPTEEPLAAGAAALLNGGAISFSIVWEDPALGANTGGFVTSRGTFDVGTMTAVYSPFLAQNEGSEVRIIGSDIYVYDGQASWTHSVSDGYSWLELMPLSGSPLVMLQRIEEVMESAPVPAPIGATGTCRRVADDPANELDAPFTACIVDSVLSWVRFEATSASGELTATFRSTAATEVTMPTEGVTEFSSSVEPQDP